MSINRVNITGNLTDEWRWVNGYDGLYAVNRDGDVIRTSCDFCRTHDMKQKKTWAGYMQVCLCKNNKKKYKSVHRLVAEAFIENIEHKPEVNHKNGDRADNRAENLEWVTRSENERHAYRVLKKKPNRPWLGKPRPNRRKFTAEQIKSIRSDTRPMTEICRDFGVSKTAIRDIRRRKNYVEVA